SDNGIYLYQFLGLHFGRDFWHKLLKSSISHTITPHLVHDLPISHTITVREAATIRLKTAKSPDRLLCRGFCQFGIRVREV
ncbi:MAG: hypothetical protein ACI4NK_02005, partial [Christensenellales bacterium]